MVFQGASQLICPGYCHVRGLVRSLAKIYKVRWVTQIQNNNNNSPTSRLEDEVPIQSSVLLLFLRFEI